MVTKDRVDFDQLVLMVAESTESLDYKTLKRVLKVMFPGLKIRTVKGNIDLYEIEWPELHQV